jgi:ribosomal protein S18 acetylase RimI-like enzyme
MNKELYFLRSSEQKIVTDMLHYAYRLDENSQTLQELPALSIYNDFYGLTAKDLGLYALLNHKIAGAIWTRRLNAEHNSTAFVNENTPVMSVAVLPEFRGKGVGSFMMEQFLQEAATLYDALSVNVLKDSKAIEFYKKFGFIKLQDSEQKSVVDNSELLIMVKKLEKKEISRPNDGYDPSKWMD